MTSKYEVGEFTSEREQKNIVPDNGITIESQNFDDLQLQAQGHKSELDRNFSFLSLLSLAFSIMVSWVTFISVMLGTLSLGGPPSSFWTPFVAFGANTLIISGLAELSSAFPSSGGPYHYAFMVAPEKYRTFAAFTAGWFNILAYILSLTSAASFNGTNIMGIVSIYYPEFQSQRYQAWLIACSTVVLSGTLATIFPKAVPRTQTFFFWGSIGGMISFAVALLAKSPVKATSESIFVTWTNVSGWTDGLAFMLAVGQSRWMFSAADCATHIAEEIPEPHKNVPRVMLSSLLVAIFTTIAFSLAFLYSCPDFAAIIASPSPMYTAFAQAVSENGALFFSTWLIWLTFGGQLAMVTTCSRIIWAFSRDNGLPYSNVFGHVNERFRIPVAANILACIIPMAIGSIYVASTTAFNTFVSCAIMLYDLSYAIPQFCLLGKGRSRLPNGRYLNLGKYFGPLCNGFTIAWVSLYVVLYCLPLYLPVTTTTMNYVSVVVVGFLTMIMGLWFVGGRKNTFEGPKVDIEVITALNLQMRAKATSDDVGKKAYNV